MSIAASLILVVFFLLMNASVQALVGLALPARFVLAGGIYYVSRESPSVTIKISAHIMLTTISAVFGLFLVCSLMSSLLTAL